MRPAARDDAADAATVRWWRSARTERGIIIASLAVPSAVMLAVGWGNLAELSGVEKVAPLVSTVLVISGLVFVWRTSFRAGAVAVGLGALTCPTGMGFAANLVVLLVAGALLASGTVIAIRDRGAPTA